MVVSDLLSQDMLPKEVQYLVGHSDPSATIGRNAHLFDETRQEAADKMDSILAPVASSVASSEKQTAVQ